MLIIPPKVNALPEISLNQGNAASIAIGVIINAQQQ